MNRRLITGLILLFLAGLLAGAGCDDPVDLCEPGVPGGVIKGRVTTGGLPLESYLTATYLDDDYDTTGEFLTVPDEAGNFSLDVPYGSYTLRLRTDRGRYDYFQGGASYRGGKDTLTVDVATPVVEATFGLGCVALEMELPRDLHGQYGFLGLQRMEDGQWAEDGPYERYDSAEILLGKLNLVVAGVQPGQYKVQVGFGCQSYNCEEFSYGEVFWLPGVHDPAQSPLITVSPDSILELSATLLGEWSRLEGKVTGAWLDMGVPNEPVVSVVAADSTLTLRSLNTDEEGNFSASFLVAGPVKLRVDQGDVSAWVGGPSFAAATVFDLVPGQTISGIEYAECGIHLVVDNNGMGSNGGDILVYDRADGSLVAEVSSWNSSQRHVAIANLWPGEYLVKIAPDGWTLGQTEWVTQWFDRAATMDQAQPVVLAVPGQTSRLDVTLERGGVINGKIIRPGEVSPSYRLEIIAAVADTLWEDVYVWSDSYTVKGLPDGDYYLALSSYFSFPELPGKVWYPGTYDQAEAQIIEIRDAAVVEGADFIVPE